MISCILQSEKEHLFGMQKLISGPTKDLSRVVPLRRQLWVATPHRSREEIPLALVRATFQHGEQT